MPVSTVEEIIEQIRKGQMVILLDDEEVDSEGFLCAAAEKVTPETINFMLLNGRGPVYLTLTDQRMKQLGIPLMVQENFTTAGSPFGASISARGEAGASASATSRAYTIRTAMAGEAKRGDLVVPGHVLPVQARNGGVLVRSGQVEASVDLTRLAGFQPGGVVCQILQDDGSLALMPHLENLAVKHKLRIVSIADLIAFRLRSECLDGF